MERIFTLFAFLDKCKEKATKIAKIGFFAFFVFLIGGFILFSLGCKEAELIFPMLSVLSFWIYLTFNDLDSCSALLRTWFLGGLVFFSVFALLLYLVSGVNLDSYPVLEYAAITFLFTIAWCLGIGVADDDAGALAAKIVNTATTLLTVAINVIALYGASQSDATWPGELQLISMYILLPIVFSGYIAALFKETQIYWRKRFLKPKEQKQK